MLQKFRSCFLLRVLAGAFAVLGLLQSGGAPRAAPQSDGPKKVHESNIERRIADLRQLFSELEEREADCAKDVSKGSTIAQWYNWPNWPNYWRDWRNWLNY